MKCPSCDAETRVIDSRESPLGVRRRRECEKKHRFSSYELDHKLLYRMIKDIMMEPGFFGIYERHLRNKFAEFLTGKPRGRPNKYLKVVPISDIDQDRSPDWDHNDYDSNGIRIAK